MRYSTHRPVRIQITTATGICAVCDMLVDGKLPQKGFVRQEEAKLSDFLANRFGRYYAPGGTKHVSGEVVVSGKAGHQRRQQAANG